MRTAVVLVAVVLLGGCSPAAGAPSPVVSSASPSMSAAPSVSASPSPSPTVAPSFPAVMPTQGADNAAIIAGWQEYWRVYDKFAADPQGYTDFSETQYVTSGEAARMILDSMATLRELNIKTLGGRQFENVRVGEIGRVDGARIAVVSYCTVTAGIKVVHADTGEPYPRDVPPRNAERLRMVEGADGKWRVSKMNIEPGGC